MASKSKLEAREKQRSAVPGGSTLVPVRAISPPPGARKRTKREPPRSAFLEVWWSQIAVALVIGFFGLIRIRLLDFPLERDEGEYAYAGQLIRHAISPYRYCYTMKLPGTAAAYALFTALFGQTAAGVHMGLLLVNAVTTILIYFLARRLFGKLAGVAASSAFALLSLEPSVFGFAAHATHFVILAAVAGILLLLKAIEEEGLPFFFWSGIALGLGFLMKQPGAFFVLFAFFYLVFAEWIRGLEWRRFVSRAGLLIFGAATPFAVTCLIMLFSGVFPRFWLWTFSYASQYKNLVSFSTGFQIFGIAVTRTVTPGILIWLIAASGTVAVLWTPKARLQTVLVLGFLLFSFAAVCPGYYFRQHYFVLALPAVSLLCGVAVSRATAMTREAFRNPWLAILPAAVFGIALGISVLHDADFFFVKDPIVSCREIYGPNPFPEAEKIADFLHARSAGGDRVAVIGSEPEIYFYSGLRSATGYVYTYPLMEPQPFATTMQHDMESEIERANPRFVVFVDIAMSWLATPNSDMGILTWSENFARDHYELVGVVDIFGEKTEYRWDTEARNYRPRSDYRVLVFEKKR